jgi:hypothetical protein
MVACAVVLKAVERWLREVVVTECGWSSLWMVVMVVVEQGLFVDDVNVSSRQTPLTRLRGWCELLSNIPAGKTTGIP